MAIFKTFRFVYCNTLNGSFFLVLCGHSAIDRYLGNDTVMKMLLQRVDGESIYIAGIDDLLKQKVNIQLIIVLLPRIAAKMLPRFKNTINTPQGL